MMHGRERFTSSRLMGPYATPPLRGRDVRGSRESAAGESRAGALPDETIFLYCSHAVGFVVR